MRGLVIEELSIFETLKSFDVDQAHWVRLPETDNAFCEVVAFIPKEALSPTEMNYCSPGRSKRHDFQYELWECHTYAIWTYHQCSWEKAIKLLVEHRINEQPIRMRIYKANACLFQSTQIEEYLGR